MLDKAKISISPASNIARPCPHDQAACYYGVSSHTIGQWNPLLTLSYQGQCVAHGWTRRKETIAHVGYTLRPGLSSESLVHWSILRALVSMSSASHAMGIPSAIAFDSTQLLNGSEAMVCLEKLGFERCGHSRSYRLLIDGNRAARLVEFKQTLNKIMYHTEQVGRGYPVDVREFNAHAVADLMDEYNRIAWGYTNWARHAELAEDEAKVIQQYVRCVGGRALEVGAGSGRVTEHLISRVSHLTAADYSEEIIDNLQMRFPESASLSLVVDDITRSAFSDSSFDLVTFWENGLGGILSENARKRAMYEMTRILKPSGQLVLALRQLPQSPVDHLMPATQNPDYMGIYHTFTPAELRAAKPPQLKEVDVIHGSARPAGGHAFFMIYTKEHV